MTGINKFSKARRFKYGINAFILTISVVGIIFIINAVIYRYSKQFDLTANKNFTLSSQTLNLLKNLEKEVDIYIFSKEGESKNEFLNDILKQYIRKSKFITVINVDLDKNPSLSDKFKVTKYGSIVFSSGKSDSQVNQTELYEFGSGMMGHGEASKFNGEQVITSNIMKITSQKKKTVYFLIGHGERLVSDMEDPGLSKIQDYLLKENYDVKSVNLSKNSNISEKDTILVIPGPKYLFLDRELKVIEDYLEKGGKVFLMIDPQVVAAKGIDKILEKWGVGLIDDIVIEPEVSYFYDPLTPIPAYEPHDITYELIRVKTSAILPGVRTVTKSEKIPDYLEAKPLLKTGGKSWAEREFGNIKPEFDKNDIKGPLTLALAVEKKKKAESNSDTSRYETRVFEEKTDGSRLVVIGDSDFISNRMTVSRGNTDLFLNTINWLAGDVEKISIRPIIMDFKKLALNKNQSKLVIIISLAIVPFLVAGIGGLIWWKRRSL
ncbi:MAG: GldG family protein [bacterium]